MNPLLGLGQFFGLLVPVGSIVNKPVHRWPDRRSYRAHQRDAAKRRNIAKGVRR